MPRVSGWAKPFVESPQGRPPGPLDQRIAQIEAVRADLFSHQRDAGRRAKRWSLYALVTFLIAINAHGWIAFLFWTATMVWGLGALLSLEAWNTARTCLQISPYEDDADL